MFRLTRISSDGPMQQMLHARAERAEQVRRQAPRLQQRLQAAHLALLRGRLLGSGARGAAASHAAAAAARAFF